MANFVGRDPTWKAGGIGVVLSPLLNLAPGSSNGPQLNQVCTIRTWRESGLGGTALLSLAPDRSSIDVELRLDQSTPAGIRLRRLVEVRSCNRDSLGDENLLIIELSHVDPALEQPCKRRTFSLTNRATFVPFRGDAKLSQSGICLQELRASSISGVSVEPAAINSTGGEMAYRGQRMRMEMEAAESSASPIAAMRHIELANLHARQLGTGSSPMVPVAH
jgi:hypothetical protein